MKQIGFKIERDVEIEGPFAGVPSRDAVFAKATVTIQGQQYRVAAIVTGPTKDFFLERLSPTEREEALGWFALVSLMRQSAEQLSPPGPGLLAEVKVEIPSGPGQRQQWHTIDAVRAHKDPRCVITRRDMSVASTRLAGSPGRVGTEKSSEAPPHV